MTWGKKMNGRKPEDGLEINAYMKNTKRIVIGGKQHDLVLQHGEKIKSQRVFRGSSFLPREPF